MNSARSILIVSLVLGVVAALAPAAGAARNWQPEEALPAGTYADPNDSRGVQSDASGDTLLAFNSSGGYRWAYRPAGGPTTAPIRWPDNSVSLIAPPLFAFDGAGDAIGWNGGYFNAYRASGAASAFTGAQVTNLAPGGTLVDVAVAPTGEAFGFFADSGNGVGRIAFRAAGSASAFDMAGSTTVDHAAGDTGVTPIGITIDPDGKAAAVFRSTPSSTYFQMTRGTGTWGTPTQITGIPAGASAIFDHAADGTAALAFVATGVASGQAVASVRAPGGSFPALTSVTTAPAGSEIGVYPKIAAANGGKAVLAFNRTRKRAGCDSPGGDNKDQGWDAYAYDGAIWTVYAAGPSAFPAASSLFALDASGSTVGLLTNSKTFTGGDPCDYGTGGENNLEVRVGTADAAGGPVELVASGLDAATFLSVSSNGNALVGYWRDSQSTQFLRAYEEPGGGSPGGGNPGGGNPGGGSTSPITAPSKVSVQGTIVVRNKIVKLPMQCQATYECYLVVTLFKVNPKDGAVVSAKPKALATVSAKLAPGAKATLKLKLPGSVISALKKAKGKKGAFYLQTRTTAGGATVKVTQKRTLKLK